MYVPAGRRIRALQRGGLGQTAGSYVCPSAEQLAGITDCSDPCQANQTSCLAATPGIPWLPVGTVGTGPLTSTNILASLFPTSAGSTTTIASALPWILGGVGLILLMGVVSGR